MKKEQVKKWLPEITAFANGKTIQARQRLFYPCWVDCNDPVFYNDDWEYRVKPESELELRAWNCGDNILGKKIRFKLNQDKKLLITGLENTNVYIASRGWMTYSTLLKDFEQLDGSPCGVMEAE